MIKPNPEKKRASIFTKQKVNRITSVNTHYFISKETGKRIPESKLFVYIRYIVGVVRGALFFMGWIVKERYIPYSIKIH